MKLIFFIFLAIEISTANIVTIGSCITQIVCELGRCNEIVATDKQSQSELENLLLILDIGDPLMLRPFYNLIQH